MIFKNGNPIKNWVKGLIKDLVKAEMKTTFSGAAYSLEQDVQAFRKSLQQATKKSSPAVKFTTKKAVKKAVKR